MDKYSKRYGKALIIMMKYKGGFAGYSKLKKYSFMPYFYYCKFTWKLSKFLNLN